MANTVVGTLNKTEGANGALVFGAGNSVTHSFGTAPTDEDGNSMNEHWSDAILGGGQKYAMGEGPLGHDELRKAMGLAMSTGGGSVVTMGNGNTSDYAVHSQIIGSGNILTGTENTPSINNTINGYGNTGRNVERMSMMGTGNNMSGSTADVVIGDYHHMDGGKNNVILGSMATEKKTVTKTYTMKDASGNVILEKKYKVTENVPIKSHTANISNAVMLGYNTDVEKDGGVAIGADSIASVDKGVAGYDPAAGDHSNDTTGTWKATAAAVSVGKAATPTSAAVTRQITNVAAGTQDTDAVNVAQLKALENKTAAEAAKHTTVTAGDYVTVTETDNSGQKNYTVTGPKVGSADGTVKITDKVENGKKVGYNLSVDTSSLGIEKTKVEAGDNVTVTSKKTGNTTTYTVNAKDTVVTGGTATYAANGTGSATLINNDGTTATITGLKDRYTSSAALDGNTLNFTRNDGSTYSVSGIASTQDIKNVTNKVGELGTRVNRAGAGAAALAALHPLDFDPDDKWDVAAGYGNYKDAHAVAVGAFYRPNEDTMFSVGGSFGGGENMVNAGVSVKLGQGNHVSTSRVALAKEIVDLRDENKDLKKRLDTMEQKMNSILGILDMGKKKDFPDVPENHWAYEYVATLAGNGILEGYPDGMFSGDRTMTRYEFAAMFYRALKNGAPVDDNMDRAMNEFEPELRQIRLDRIRVDRISGKDNDRNKVERVRVNSEDDKANNDYRDVYGSHISPEA